MKFASWFVPSLVFSCLVAAACGSSTGGGGTSTGAGAQTTSSTTGNFLSANSSTTTGNFLAASSSTTSSTTGSGFGGSTSTTSSTTGSGFGGSTNTSNASSTTSSGFATSSSSSGSPGAPTTCAQADTTAGCCTAAGVLYFCNTATDPAPTEQVCTGGNVCGWSATEGYYDCVAPPSMADPSNTYPLLCQ